MLIRYKLVFDGKKLKFSNHHFGYTVRSLSKLHIFGRNMLMARCGKGPEGTGRDDGVTTAW